MKMLRLVRGALNRLLQVLALYAPGGRSVKPFLHRLRGVRMGTRVWIGTDCLLETLRPDLISLGNNVVVGIRVVMIAHFREMGAGKRSADLPTITIEDDVYIGPGVIILPNVRIGRGSVITAGSVVNSSIPPMTMVRGNPATPVAICGVPLAGTSYKNFLRHVRPIAHRHPPTT
jgi:acetyltransferase-like isoleucine patch superfamily enzyme